MTEDNLRILEFRALKTLRKILEEMGMGGSGEIIDHDSVT